MDWILDVFLVSTLDGGGGQVRAPAALPQGKKMHQNLLANKVQFISLKVTLHIFHYAASKGKTA